jgi:molybdopterin molybdotransferase
MNAVTVSEAVAALLRAVSLEPTLRLPLGNAAGHVLAEEIVARWPLPPWTAASMDGYALRASDITKATVGTPMSLPVAGTTTAGAAEPPPLAPGRAWRVATGGRVPTGADSVIRQEDTESDGRVVMIRNDRDAGRNIRPIGGDIAVGELALGPGVVLGPGQLALLAALGVTAPAVIRRPRIATLTSGDEVGSLDRIEEIADGSHIADANTPMLESLITATGGVAAPIGLLPDDRKLIAESVAASAADLIISAGAVSVGEHDHIPGAMADLGGELLFRRVLLRPGSPTTACHLPDGRIWLALPGNPVSAMVTFHLFARPLIRAMLGDPDPITSSSRVILGEPVARHSRLELFLRVTLSPGVADGPPLATLTGNQGSWVLSSIARADGVVRIAAGEGTTGPTPLPFLRF